MPAPTTAATAPAAGIFRSMAFVLYQWLTKLTAVAARTGTITPEATSVPHVSGGGSGRSPPRNLRGRSVRALDIPQAPVDLRGRIRLPAAARAGHLGARIGLRDAIGVVVGVGGVVGGVLVPSRLLL